MAGVELASAYISLSVAADKIAPEVNKQLRGVEGDFEKTGKKSGAKFAKAAGAAAAAGAAVFGAGKLFGGAIREASDLNESVNAVEVTFGKSAKGIQKLADEAANGLGLSKTEFQGLSVQFSAFAQSIAGKGGDVVGVMDDLTTRGADFASVMNLEVTEAMGLFQSGLAGETEPLRKFGIDLSAAAVEAHALEKGITDNAKEMTEAEKVQARYSLLMEQTSKTAGDFGNTSDSLANSQRRLSANWKNIQAQIGAGLLPIMEKLSNFVVDKALPAISGLFEKWREGDGIFGRVKDMFGGVKDVITEVQGGFKAFTAAWVYNDGEITSSGFPGVMERIGYWARQAFDYIRNVAIPAVQTFIEEFKNGTGAGGQLRDILERVWSVAQDAFNFMRDEGLPALRNLWRFIVEKLWPDIKTAFIDRIWPAMKQVGTVIWNLWNEDAKPALEGLWKFIRDTLAPFLVDFYENGVKPTFDLIGKAIEGAYKFSRDVLRKFKTEVSSLKDRFVAVRDGIRDAWRGLTNIIARPINAVIDKINAFLSGMKSALNQIPGVDLTGTWQIRKIILDTASGTIGGGPNRMYASGGRVAGWSPHDRADNIPAMLTAGEYVLPVAATRSLAQRFGPGFLEALRRGLPGFASGGAVSHGDKRVGGFLADGWEWLADLVSDAKGWVKRKFEDLLSGIGTSWPAVAAKGAAMSGVEGLAGWIKANIFGGGEMSGGQRANYGGAYGWAPQGLPWQAIWSLIKMAAPEAVMTSNYRAGAITASGVPSLHGQGRAVDIVSGNMRQTFLKLLPLLKWSQLFYSPMGGLQVGYRDAIVHRTHFDHIHAALADGGYVRPPVFDRGGTLAPGLNLIDNQTGGPESLRNADLPVDLSDSTLRAMGRLFMEAMLRGAERQQQLERMG